jgi:hypothetical protein
MMTVITGLSYMALRHLAVTISIPVDEKQRVLPVFSKA